MTDEQEQEEEKPRWALMAVGNGLRQVPDYFVNEHWFVPDDMLKANLVPVRLTNGLEPANLLTKGINVMPVIPCYARPGKGHVASTPSGKTVGGLTVQAYELRVVNIFELGEFMTDPAEFARTNGIIPM